MKTQEEQEREIRRSIVQALFGLANKITSGGAVSLVNVAELDDSTQIEFAYDHPWITVDYASGMDRYAHRHVYVRVWTDREQLDNPSMPGIPG